MSEAPTGAFRLVCLLGLVALFVPALAPAYLDLSRASIEQLDNGLTVIVLEDPSFPVVSVQMLYRSGARDEVNGKTGLAHFLEHMAFRDSENFPDTELVGSIYAVGGEWHGYTWLDQTTYFATVPSEKLDLLLRIESDRMARLVIPKADVQVETGAVLSEMHGYENNPASVLHDYVIYVALLANTYRHNTIGWESDVAGITHEDLVSFYRQHYQPANAVLAVVGDVRKADVMRRVRAHFAALQGAVMPPEHYTPEPVQAGERRILLHGELDRKEFKIVYRAPAVSSADYVPFLMVQELLSAGSGVSFLQDDGDAPARPGSALDGISDDLTTWFPPSEDDYVFIISGSIPVEEETQELEEAVQAGIDRLRGQFQTPGQSRQAALEAARERVLRELVFDVQTTEDAAHQLAFFSGLGALDVLTGLPGAVQAVSAEDIRRVLNRYLAVERKTTGWYLPIEAGSREPAPMAETAQHPPRLQSDLPVENSSAGERQGPAVTGQLSNGVPVIFKRSTASPTAVLRVVTPRMEYALPAWVESSEPAWGIVALDFELFPEEFTAVAGQARAILDSATPAPVEEVTDTEDPVSMLRHYRRELLGLGYPDSTGPAAPVLLVVAGDVEPEFTMRQLEKEFGDMPAGQWKPLPVAEPRKPVEVQSAVLYPIAQERVGYLVQVPGPRPGNTAAWQMALYILSHGYEGRLGKEAISRRGLVYYIDSQYETDGQNDWITLDIGVDPVNRPAMVKLLKKELVRLLSDPPTLQEVDEARGYLLGRYVSAAQSNLELVDSLSAQWLRFGGVLEYDAWEQQLAAVQRQDILNLLPAFTRGSIVSITNPHPLAYESDTSAE